MLSLPNRMPGDNISILNTYYQYPQKMEIEANNKTGEMKTTYSKDYICIVYKDNDKGTKHHAILENPDYEFYMVNPEESVNYNRLFIEKEKVHPIITPYNNLDKKIAELTNNLDTYYANLHNGNRRANRILHSNYDVFNSDTNINDHYRFQFDKTYKNEPTPITKAYFDIEVDTIHMAGDFPELGECPVNAVSYIFNDTINVFLLRNEKNPLIKQFEEKLKANPSAWFGMLNKMIIDHVGGIDKAKKFKLDNLDYQVLFYDEEICLLHDLFSLINQQEPDFLLAWNMPFDIPQIVERIYALGYDPLDIMCHPDFDKKYRVVKYFIDERHKTEYAERGDYFTVSGHTVYLDQLVQFASRRKGQSAFPNFKLDTAGSIIAGVNKLDYSDITTDISKFPYLNYEMFVIYNILDTVVQKCIEEEVKDVDYIYTKCLSNNTRYDKGHRQTVYLVNRAAKSFYANGYIIGNNVSSGDSIKFKAALVHDPTNNRDTLKKKIGNQVINVADNLNDFDFKSLYPSTARENNMAPNTQIGKIIIDEQIHKYENPFNDPMYDRGGQFIEDLTCQNTITFCQRWLHLATFEEWLKDLDYYYMKICSPVSFPYGKSKDLIIRCDSSKGKKINLIEDAPELKNNKIPLLYRIPKKLDYQPYIDQIERGVY